MNTQKIDTRVSPGLERAIRELAKKEGRSFSGQIRWMLEQYYKQIINEDNI